MVVAPCRSEKKKKFGVRKKTLNSRLRKSEGKRKTKKISRLWKSEEEEEGIHGAHT